MPDAKPKTLCRHLSCKITFWRPCIWDVPTPQEKPRPIALHGPDTDDELLTFLQQTFSTSYYKEIDQDETVWRSLPFFATGLAALLTATSSISWKFPRDGDPGIIVLWFYLLVVLFAASVLITIYFLWYSTRGEQYAHPSYETDVLNNVVHWEWQARQSSARNPTKGLLRKTRNILINQYAQAASQNRVINARRVKGRLYAN